MLTPRNPFSVNLYDENAGAFFVPAFLRIKSVCPPNAKNRQKVSLGKFEFLI